MTYEAQHNAIRTRFNTQWASTTPIKWANVPFDPPNDDAWVELSVGDAGAIQASMGDPGNNTYRHTGAVTVMIFTPSGQGDKEALELADQAAAVFRAWQSGGILFRPAPFIRRIGTKDNWFQVNVVCPFQRDDVY